MKCLVRFCALLLNEVPAHLDDADKFALDDGPDTVQQSEGEWYDDKAVR